MTTAERKVLRDFWLERTRTALVVLAIAMGISGFAAVLSCSAILTRELNDGYLATNPASATLRTDSIDDELLSEVLSNREVSDAEARRMLSGRMKAGPAQWRNLRIFVVKDFRKMRVSTVNPEHGAWPPAPGEILIERDAFQVARARTGDLVTVRTYGGQERTLRVSGGVHDTGQAQARMENIVYGYITPETLTQLGEEPYLDQLKILVAENRFDEHHVRSVAEQIRTLLESRGHPVAGVEVPTPGKHPHADIMQLLLLTLASFGLFVLLLSGILVVNLLTALMASQVRQIGVMKVIGGTRVQIARIYLGQALLLGLAASALAYPVGALGSRLLCRYMGVFLNFDINSFGAPVWVYLLIAAVGLVVPLLAAAYPVWKGTGVSVRAALADFGLSQNAFGKNALDRALARMGGVARPLILAIRNSFRRRTRMALTLLTLALGGLFFIAAFNIRASMISTLDRMFALKKFDLSVDLAQMYPLESIERAVGKTPGILRAEGWIITEGGVLGRREPPPDHGAASERLHAAQGIGSHHGGIPPASDRFTVIALPPKTDLLSLDIVAGRSLRNEDTDALIANTALAARFPPTEVGNAVSVRLGHVEASLRLIGIAREPFSPPVAYIPRSSIEQRGNYARMANNLRIVLDAVTPASIESVKASLDRNLEREGVRALTSLSKSDSRFGFDQHMLMIYVALIIMSCVIGGVGGLGLMTTMSLSVLERRREMGVLRAIGASPKIVWLIVVAEGGVIGVLSWGLAAVVAWPLSKGLGDLLARSILKSSLDFSYELRGVFIWLAVSLLFAALSSFLPAWKASRRPVREALAYE